MLIFMDSYYGKLKACHLQGVVTAGKNYRKLIQGQESEMEGIGRLSYPKKNSYQLPTTVSHMPIRAKMGRTRTNNDSALYIIHAVIFSFE